MSLLWNPTKRTPQCEFCALDRLRRADLENIEMQDFETKRRRFRLWLTQPIVVDWYMFALYAGNIIAWGILTGIILNGLFGGR